MHYNLNYFHLLTSWIKFLYFNENYIIKSINQNHVPYYDKLRLVGNFNSKILSNQEQYQIETYYNHNLTQIIIYTDHHHISCKVHLIYINSFVSSCMILRPFFFLSVYFFTVFKANFKFLYF